jgi:hypothetical protein
MAYRVTKEQIVQILAQCLYKHGSMEAVIAYIDEYAKTGNDATVCAEFIATNDLWRYDDKEEMIRRAKDLAIAEGSRQRAAQNARAQQLKSDFLKAYQGEKGHVGRVRHQILTEGNSSVSDADCRQLLLLWSKGHQENSQGLERLEPIERNDFIRCFDELSTILTACGLNLPDFGKVRSPGKSDEPRNSDAFAFIIICSILAASCLVLAFVEFGEIWVYQISKWLVLTGGTYCLYLLRNKGVRWGLVPLVLVMILLNPVAALDFGGDEWFAVHLLATTVFSGYLVFFGYLLTFGRGIHVKL